MAGEPWTDEGTKEFKAFQNLERLHLECTKVTGVTLGEIATLPKLTYLNLCNTAVGDPAVGQLERLKSLRKLYVYGNLKPTPYRWKAEGAAILQKIQRARLAQAKSVL